MTTNIRITSLFGMSVDIQILVACMCIDSDRTMVKRERNSRYLDFEAAGHCCSWWCVSLWRMLLLPAVGGLVGGLREGGAEGREEEEKDFFDEEGRIGLMVVNVVMF